MVKFASMLIVLAMFALPGQALAQGSGDDVYTEDPPTAGNNNPPGGNNNPPSGNDGSSSPSGSTAGDAVVQGEDGAAAADLAESTGPDGDGSNSGGGSGGSGSGGSGSGNDGSGTGGAEPSSGSSAGAGDVVVEIADGSDDGVGLLLPFILGLVLFAGVAFVAIRRRSSSPGTA